ncbi:hypothetical protein [Flavihumibacter fluvii]|nr:hypothetical protein [Flavihumibacter fluvii]
MSNAKDNLITRNMSGSLGQQVVFCNGGRADDLHSGRSVSTGASP